MNPSARAPFLPYSEIESISSRFLREHHPSGSIPVPIEEIIELSCAYNIIPYDGLYRNHSQNGFILHNMHDIYVDRYQYENYLEKYRFTIAHELGHIILHYDYFRQVGITSENEYFDWFNNVDQDVMSWLETHCDDFAGLILVPTEPLIRESQVVVDRHRTMLRSLPSIPESVWSYLAKEISVPFNVSPITVEIRIRKSNLAQRIPI